MELVKPAIRQQSIISTLRVVYDLLDNSIELMGDLDQMPKEKVDAYVVRTIAWVFGYLENPKKMMFGSD